MKIRISQENQLALKITAVISAVLILVLVFFTGMLRWGLTHEKSIALKRAYDIIENYIEEDKSLVYDISSIFLELPYFVDFSVYDYDSKKTLSANNNFIQLLPETNGKAVHYMQKDYYMDGNLDVLYLTQTLTLKNDSENSYTNSDSTSNAHKVLIQTSIDIENDSASKLIYYMPNAIPIIIIPVILLSYFILLFFIKRDFQREHNFSANVSHELQTPVNAILGHAKLLERWGKDDKAQTEKSLKIIINETLGMKATINNLLEITKLEKKLVEPKREPVQIEEFFNSIKDEFKYLETVEILTQTNGIQMIETNNELFHQIFVIAISNSIKFSKSDCKIILRSFTEKHHHVFEIEDNGTGFSKAIIPHIFDRFYRGDEAHSRSKGGAGLGLSIAKSIAIALNAKISARNAEKNGTVTGAIIRLEM